MKLKNRILTFSLGAACVLSFSQFGLAISSTVPANNYPPAYEPAQSPLQTQLQCTTQETAAVGAVKNAATECIAWAKQHDKDSGDNDDEKVAKEILNEADSDHMSEKTLRHCKIQYENHGQCVMPRKQADEDSDSDDPVMVYNPEEKGPNNSPACKAQYAKTISKEKKDAFDEMDKAETKNTQAQEKLAEAMKTDQDTLMEKQKELAEIQPKLQADLLKVQENLTKEGQKEREDINTLLAQMNAATSEKAAITQQINDLIASYKERSKNLQNECKMKVRASNFQSGGSYAPNLDFLTKCVLQGGSQVCKCKEDQQYLDKQEDIREQDQDRLTALNKQLREAGIRAAQLANSLTNSRQNLQEDQDMGKLEIAQRTQADSQRAQQLNQQISQIQMRDQQTMMRLQAQAKTDQSEFEESKEDYIAARKASKSLAGYNSASDNDDANGNDPKLETISDGVKNYDAAYNAKCSAAWNGTDSPQTTVQGNPAGKAPTRATASTSGSAAGSNGASQNPGAFDCGSGPCLTPGATH